MNRRSSRSPAHLIVAAALATALVTGQAAAAKDTPTDAEPEEVVTIDFLQPLPKSMAFYPLFVGDVLGYFAEEGIEVNLLPSGDIPATVIVPSGQADIGATTPTNIVQAAAAEEDFVLVYEYYQHNVVSIVVPADSDVETIADLEGMTVGVTSEGAGDAALARAALQEVGLSPDDDVEIVVAGDGGPAVAEALRGGRLDAFSGAINDIVALQVAGIELREITPDSFALYPASSMIVRSGTLEEEADSITRFLRAWSKATYAGMLNRDMVFAIAEDEVPEETGDEEFGRIFLDLAIDLQTPVEGIDAFGSVRPDAWTVVQEAMVEGGELEEVFDPSTFLDDSLLADVNDWDRDEVESEVDAWAAENL
jgi:NitT/TauT family transport system substrate-binding protein